MKMNRPPLNFFAENEKQAKHQLTLMFIPRHGPTLLNTNNLQYHDV
jgi:hypothetical protein